MNSAVIPECRHWVHFIELSDIGVKESIGRRNQLSLPGFVSEGAIYGRARCNVYVLIQSFVISIQTHGSIRNWQYWRYTTMQKACVTILQIVWHGIALHADDRGLTVYAECQLAVACRQPVLWAFKPFFERGIRGWRKRCVLYTHVMKGRLVLRLYVACMVYYHLSGGTSVFFLWWVLSRIELAATKLSIIGTCMMSELYYMHSRHACWRKETKIHCWQLKWGAAGEYFIYVGSRK